MLGRLRFPIRLKILVTLLFVVTGVVSAITVIMANFFHEDKKTYIRELVSMMAISTAEECRSILVGYQERLQVYGRIIAADDLEREVKGPLLDGLFRDFPELVAIAAENEHGLVASAYDGEALREAGLSKQDLIAERERYPLSFERILDGEIHVSNSTASARLPTLTLAIPTEQEPGVEPLVVSAVIRLDGLWRVAARGGGFEVFVADADGTLLAHSDRPRVARRDRIALDPDVVSIAGQYNASLAREYLEDGKEMLGGFAGVSFGTLISGAQARKSVAYLASRDLLWRLVLLALGLLALATIVALFWAHRLTRPVERLSEATREIAKGSFDVHVKVDSRDEIGALAGSFNQMAAELDTREAALQEAQAQLVQSEKMAAFGQLGAGIAHEVKNPLAGILGCAQLSLRKVEKDTVIEKNLQLIEKETRRCKSIIENLLRFARQERAAMQPIPINPVVVDAVAIVSHQLGMAQVDLQQDLAQELPEVHGNANQLQQVLMNLMMNAQQAMEGEPGTVTVSTAAGESGQVEIRVADTGPGIPPENREKLFEPFFTTKPGGKGTGLGLSVSFGIVQDHGGEISVDSTPGEGATFVITLPMLDQEPSVRGG